MKLQDIVLQNVLNAPVPAPTKSYSPVPHKDILDDIYEGLDKAGLKVRNTILRSDNNGQKVVGRINLEESMNGISMSLAFKNSYDKSMSLGFAAGGNVLVCSNGVVRGEIKLIRKHTGSVATEIKQTISSSLKYLEQELILINKDAEEMKKVEFDKKTMAQLIGEMYINESLCTATQLSIIKKELDVSTHFKENNLWCLYNHFTEAFKTSHSVNVLDDHLNLHNYVKTNILAM